MMLKLVKFMYPYPHNSCAFYLQYDVYLDLLSSYSKLILVL